MPSKWTRFFFSPSHSPHCMRCAEDGQQNPVSRDFIHCLHHAMLRTRSGACRSALTHLQHIKIFVIHQGAPLYLMQHVLSSIMHPPSRSHTPCPLQLQLQAPPLAPHQAANLSSDADNIGVLIRSCSRCHACCCQSQSCKDVCHVGGRIMAVGLTLYKSFCAALLVPQQCACVSAGAYPRRLAWHGMIHKCSFWKWRSVRRSAFILVELK